jgi:putative SOS response-associated peptidase YedK
MCGRYGRRADKQRIAEWFRTHNTDVFDEEYYETNERHFTPSHNITPQSIQPVVRHDHDTGERVLALMKWGLVPYWSKTPKVDFSSINARADKLTKRRMARTVEASPLPHPGQCLLRMAAAHQRRGETEDQKAVGRFTAG